MPGIPPGGGSCTTHCTNRPPYKQQIKVSLGEENQSRRISACFIFGEGIRGASSCFPENIIFGLAESFQVQIFLWIGAVFFFLFLSNYLAKTPVGRERKEAKLGAFDTSCSGVLLFFFANFFTKHSLPKKRRAKNKIKFLQVQIACQLDVTVPFFFLFRRKGEGKETAAISQVTSFPRAYFRFSFFPSFFCVLTAKKRQSSFAGKPGHVVVVEICFPNRWYRYKKAIFFLQMTIFSFTSPLTPNRLLSLLF